MSPMLKFYCLIIVCLFAINTQPAFAGGGNGSEVLGEVKTNEDPAESKPLLESLKGIFSKDKKNGDACKNGGKNADGSINSDCADGDGKKNGKNGNGSDSANKNDSDGKGNGDDSDGKNGNNKKKLSKLNSGDSDFPLECVVTPSLKPDHIPLKSIKKANNLLRKPGSARRANGQYVQIVGHVVDEDCLPIPDVEVQIWQTDSAGKYEDDYDTNSEWEPVSKTYDKNFGYSGAAQTNNLGEFSFITILPAMYNKDLAPHINFYVRHPEYKEIATMMFFGKHPRNDIDKNLKTLTPDERDVLISNGRRIDPQDMLDGRVYDFLITMQGVSKHKRY
jgi:protocatechuate 3,4-dioxygenase beta subunit